MVGDEDQSIYSWRGADYENIFRFEQDFPGTRMILLEQNYRSTQPLLDAASAVIQHNPHRKAKVLWCGQKRGSRPQLYEADDAQAEAQFVAERLWQLARTDRGRCCAVLYRTNAQSRLYEEALRRLGMTYRIVGGLPFLRDHFGEVDFSPDGDGTLVVWRCRFAPRIPGLGGLLRRMIERTFRGALEGLAKHRFPER